MAFYDHYHDLMRGRDPVLRRFRSLIEPQPPKRLEALAHASRRTTDHHFGRTMRLFAPLYLSNECVNNCRYCGFSRDNPILRVTLDPGQVVEEARHLHRQGFRNILLVAGEHPKFVNEGYIQEILDRLRGFIPTLALEIGPMEDDQYGEIVRHGAEGLVVYQETYDEEAYRRLHTAGPKKNFAWRLACPERAYRGGFRRIGIGALFGLSHWRREAVALAAHLRYLQRTCWKAAFTVSFPRLRPHAGQDQFQPDPEHTLDDRSLVQLVLAFRLCFPETGIVLSTREPAPLRDALFNLGVTHASAGARTDPGGYTGNAAADLHRTVRGRRVELEDTERPGCQQATGQFDIADHRSPAEVADQLARLGLEPVWKDWDPSLLAPTG